MEDIAFFFDSTNDKPAFSTCDSCDHGRIETRNIWVTTKLNEYLEFPHVGQAFRVERISYNKKTGKETRVVAHGITSKTPDLASAEQVLQDNRGHWCIENSCHYIIDWNYDEDRSRISKGYGPENITRIRRFAVGLIKSKGVRNVAQKMRQLSFNVRPILDYFKMTLNTRCASTH